MEYQFVLPRIYRRPIRPVIFRAGCLTNSEGFSLHRHSVGSEVSSGVNQGFFDFEPRRRLALKFTAIKVPSANAFLTSMLDRLTNLGEKLQALRCCQAILVTEIFKRHPFDQLHHKVRATRLGSSTVNHLDGIRMVVSANACSSASQSYEFMARSIHCEEQA